MIIPKVIREKSPSCCYLNDKRNLICTIKDLYDQMNINYDFLTSGIIEETIKELIPEVIELIDTTFYLGVGNSVDSVMVDDNKYVKNKNIDSDIILNSVNQKIYFIIPITGYTITMSNIPIPVDINQVTIDDVTYNVYSSKNNYTGEISLQIHKLNN